MRHTFIKIVIGCFAVWPTQSCRKDVPRGQSITANGTVLDIVQQRALPNVMVYLFGGHFYGSFLRSIAYDTIPLDSVMTDANGNFSLSYIAEGKSDDYALGVTKNYLKPTNNENILPAFQNIYKFNYAYNLKNIIITARALHQLNVTLQILSNPYDTLLFRIYNPPSGQEIAEYQLYGYNVNTVLHTRYLPLSKNIFEYSVRTLNLIDSGYIRLTADTINMGNPDTIFISQKINSTYDIPLKPY
ncbi:MAG TPA: hypothetical protein VMT76_17525 [Puia sp.]|nr:hypothetical protein [Puia sp.]